MKTDYRYIIRRLPAGRTVTYETNVQTPDERIAHLATFKRVPRADGVLLIEEREGERFVYGPFESSEMTKEVVSETARVYCVDDFMARLEQMYQLSLKEGKR